MHHGRRPDLEAPSSPERTASVISIIPKMHISHTHKDVHTLRHDQVPLDRPDLLDQVVPLGLEVPEMKTQICKNNMFLSSESVGKKYT